MIKPIFFFTGGSGFLASDLFNFLNPHYRCHLFSRSVSSGFIYKPYSSFQSLLSQSSCPCVVHCAGLAHLRTVRRKLIPSYYDANVSFALKVAQQAIDSRAKHFIYISSIGVHGNGSSSTDLYTISESSQFRPYNYYTYSKLVAELLLINLFNTSSTRLTILRPPLIYSPNSPGNLKYLRKYISFGFPVPVSIINPYRSLIYSGNIASLISKISISEYKSPRAFVVSDAKPIRLSSLLLLLSPKSISRPFPQSIVLNSFLDHYIRFLPFMSDLYQQLNSSLVVDSSSTFNEFDWFPPYSISSSFL